MSITSIQTTGHALHWATSDSAILAKSSFSSPGSSTLQCTRERLEIGGFRSAIRKLTSRMSRLYLVHIATITLSLAVIAAGLRLGLKLYDGGEYAWMTDPHRYILRILTMSYAPGLNSLLPLYIVTAPALLLAIICLRKAHLCRL